MSGRGGGGTVMTGERERDLERDLLHAVDRGEIVAVFQPQIDIASREIVAAETLARWNHPDLGLIMPGEFIPIAESSDVIHDLGRHMIDDALAAVAHWRTRGVALEVSVNVSATQLTTLEFYDRLDADLDRLALAPDALTIEITESFPVIETPSVMRRLDRLRAEGLGISVDDFGAGHSTLQQLEKLPATEVKFDQTLVRSNDRESTDLMHALIELAHWRGLRVVAEGVETEQQLHRMRELGCDRAQGYLLGYPMARDEVEALLD